MRLRMRYYRIAGAGWKVDVDILGTSNTFASEATTLFYPTIIADSPQKPDLYSCYSATAAVACSLGEELHNGVMVAAYLYSACATPHPAC